MKILFLIISIFLLSSPSWSEGVFKGTFWCGIFGLECKEIPSHRLIENGGVYFEVGKNNPFNGRTVEYKNGEIYLKIYFKDGLLKKRETYKNGEVYLKTYFEGGLLNKRERFFNKELRSSLEFKNDKPHGEWKLYRNNKVTELGFFENGTVTGTWIHYDEEGKEKLRLDFVDLGNDWVGGYYKNGKLNQTGQLKIGEPEGSWQDYHENGQLESEMNFKDGEPEGLFKVYYDNGQLKWKGNIKDGEYTTRVKC